MVGAVAELQQALGAIDLDAEEGRHTWSTVDLLVRLSGEGRSWDVVILHIGDNGILSAKQFDDIMKLLSNVQRVIWVNDKVPREWEDLNNTVFAAGCKRYATAVLVDWHAFSANRPELFWEDGIHVRPEGATAYAALIAAAVALP
jgi:hypothetical protein